MVSSVSSDSHRISFVIFTLFIRIFTLLFDLILKFFFFFNFHISGVFFLKFVLLFPLSLVEVHNFPVQFCLCLLYYFLSFSNFIYHYQGFPLLALVQHFPSVIFFGASAICEISATVNLLSLSTCLLTFASLFASVFCQLFKFFFLQNVYVCLALTSLDG